MDPTAGTLTTGECEQAACLPPQAEEEPARVHEGEASKPLRFGPMERVEVQCNGMLGTLLITTQAIVCKCAECIKAGGSQAGMGGRVMTPTEFERHSGMCSSKKWRRSIKVVDPGGKGRGGTMSVGRWLELHGFIVVDKKEDKKDEKKEHKGHTPCKEQGRSEHDPEPEMEPDLQPDAELRLEPEHEPFFMRPTLPPVFPMHTMHAAAAAAAAAAFMQQPGMGIFGRSGSMMGHEGWPHERCHVQGPPGARASISKQTKPGRRTDNDVLLAANALGLLGKAPTNSGSESQGPKSPSKEHTEGSESSSHGGNGRRKRSQTLRAQQDRQQPMNLPTSNSHPQHTAQAGTGRLHRSGRAQAGQHESEPTTRSTLRQSTRRRLREAVQDEIQDQKQDETGSESDSAGEQRRSMDGVPGFHGLYAHQTEPRPLYQLPPMHPLSMGMGAYAHPHFMSMLYDPVRASLHQQHIFAEMSRMSQLHKATMAGAQQVGGIKRKPDLEQVPDGEEEEEEEEDDNTPLAPHVMGVGFTPSGGHIQLLPPPTPMAMLAPHAAALVQGHATGSPRSRAKNLYLHGGLGGSGGTMRAADPLMSAMGFANLRRGCFPPMAMSQGLLLNGVQPLPFRPRAATHPGKRPWPSQVEEGDRGGKDEDDDDDIVPNQ